MRIVDVMRFRDTPSLLTRGKEQQLGSEFMVSRVCSVSPLPLSDTVFSPKNDNINEKHQTVAVVNGNEADSLKRLRNAFKWKN
jgi:hypothetical protein